MTERYIEILKEQLPRHEGVRLKMYQDTVGKWTIGIGRNIEDNGVSIDEALYMLENDIKTAIEDAKKLVQNFDTLSENRKAVVVNMSFNMGYNTLSQFKNTLRAIIEGRWEDAAKGMEKSKWYRQVKGRAVELVDLMRRG